MSVVKVAVRLGPSRLKDHPWREMVTHAGLALLVVSLAVIAVSKLAWRRKPIVTVGLISVFVGSALFVMFKDSVLPFEGLAGDNAFVISYVTKFGAYASPIDFYYKLPSFYPPLYWWLLGRIAALVRNAPWKMVQIGMIWTSFLTPWLTYALWRPKLGRALSAILALGVLAYQDFPKPPAWLAATLFVPWYVRFIAPGRERPRGRSEVMLAGVIGGLIILLQYYWLFIGAVAVIGHFAFEILRGRSSPKDFVAWLRVRLPIGVIALLVSSPYWMPYLISVARCPHPETLQNRWFTLDMPNFHWPSDSLKVYALLTLVGFGAAVARSGRDRVAATLVQLQLGAYGWFSLGLPADLVKKPLLSFKTNYLVNYLFVTTGLYVLGRLLLSRQATKRRFAALALGVVVLFSGQDLVNQDNGLAHAYGYRQDLADGIRAATGGDGRGLVIVNSFWELPVYLPVFDFQIRNPHLAHPAAQFSLRNRFLEKLGAETDPEVFAFAWQFNTYDKVDLFYLDSNYELAGGDQNFPLDNLPFHVRFSPSFFVEPYFQHLGRKQDIIYKPLIHQGPVAEAMDSGAIPAAFEDQVTAYLLVARYGSHIHSNIKLADLRSRVLSALRSADPASLKSAVRLLRASNSDEGLTADEHALIERKAQPRIAQAAKQSIEFEADLATATGKWDAVPAASGVSRVARRSDWGGRDAAGCLDVGPFDDEPAGSLAVTLGIGFHQPSANSAGVSVQLLSSGRVLRELEVAPDPSGFPPTQSVVLTHSTAQPLDGMTVRICAIPAITVELQSVTIKSTPQPEELAAFLGASSSYGVSNEMLKHIVHPH